MTEYFRPEVDKRLQYPLRVAAVKLKKTAKEIATEALRSFLECVLEDNSLGENASIEPEILKRAIKKIQTVDPL